jgi:hypothetical protein
MADIEDILQAKNNDVTGVNAPLMVKYRISGHFRST